MGIYAEADGVGNEIGLAVDALTKMMTEDVIRDRSAERRMVSRIDCTMEHYDVGPSCGLLVHAHADLVHVHFHCARSRCHKDSNNHPLNQLLDYSSLS